VGWIQRLGEKKYSDHDIRMFLGVNSQMRVQELVDRIHEGEKAGKFTVMYKNEKSLNVKEATFASDMEVIINIVKTCLGALTSSAVLDALQLLKTVGVSYLKNFNKDTQYEFKVIAEGEPSHSCRNYIVFILRLEFEAQTVATSFFFFKSSVTNAKCDMATFKLQVPGTLVRNYLTRSQEAMLYEHGFLGNSAQDVGREVPRVSVFGVTGLKIGDVDAVDGYDTVKTTACEILGATTGVKLDPKSFSLRFRSGDVIKPSQAVALSDPREVVLYIKVE